MSDVHCGSIDRIGAKIKSSQISTHKSSRIVSTYHQVGSIGLSCLDWLSRERRIPPSYLWTCGALSIRDASGFALWWLSTSCVYTPSLLCRESLENTGEHLFAAICYALGDLSAQRWPSVQAFKSWHWRQEPGMHAGCVFYFCDRSLIISIIIIPW